MRAYAWMITLVCLFAFGCEPQFSGTIVFKNDSDTVIWVDQVVGFEKEPPCGYLVTGGSATASMGQMPMPKQASLIWRQKGKDLETSVINLSKLRASGARQCLVFRYTEARRWVSELE